MTHIRIEQEGLDTNVSNKIVNKLYNEVHDGQLDESSNLKGSISVKNCYESEKNYLESQYPEFSITCTGQYYIDFQDPEALKECLEVAGDGMGITKSQAASVTIDEYDYTFNNSNIQYFDEFKYFTKVKEFNQIRYYSGGTYNYKGRFEGCNNLISIDVSNITDTDRNNEGSFKNCSKLETVKNFKLDTIQISDFEGCTSLTTINLSNLKIIRNNGFYNCHQLNLSQNGLDFSKLEDIYPGAFYNCVGVGDVQLGIKWNIGNAFESTDMTSLVGICMGTSSLPTFRNCTKLNKIDITLVSNPEIGMFKGDSKLKIIKITENIDGNITEFNTSVITSDLTNLKAVVFNVKTPPSTPVSYNSLYPRAGSSLLSQIKLYVPDDSLEAYTDNGSWKYYGFQGIYPISQFSTDFPND